MPKPRDVVLAAIGPPRRHVAALGRLQPFLEGDDAKLRDAACALATEILDDYGGGNNALPLVDAVARPLLALAKRGVPPALEPLAEVTWVLWKQRAYPEVVPLAEHLASLCDATPSEKCLTAAARKGLGKGATRTREGWMYRRMLLEAATIDGTATAALESSLRAQRTCRSGSSSHRPTSAQRATPATASRSACSRRCGHCAGSRVAPIRATTAARLPSRARPRFSGHAAKR